MIEDIINELKCDGRNPRNTDYPEYFKRVEPDSSNCSCSECDSLKCFAIRRELNNKCICSQKSHSCFQNFDIKDREKAPKLTTKSIISIVQKNVDFENKTSYLKTIRSRNSKIDQIVQSKFSYTAVTESQGIGDTDVAEQSMTNSLRNINQTTAQLSAQVMNVAFQDFNESLSMDRPYNDSLTELSTVKQDILTRLKAIYNACSCKVCECIPIKSFFPPKDSCSCKPCQCNECNNLSRYIGNIKETPHSGCPCIRCDRKECRGVVKKTLWVQTCDCKPCDCLNCSESYSTHCNCEPCACLECRTKATHLTRNFIVASIAQNNQMNTCNCDSPCECSNCVPSYGTTGTLQERSTGTVTRSLCPCESCMNHLCQADDANCRCEIKRRIITKPIQRDQHDYDIRNVLIKQKMWPNWINEYGHKGSTSRCDTIQQNVVVGNEHNQRENSNVHLNSETICNGACGCYSHDRGRQRQTTSKHTCHSCEHLDYEDFRTVSATELAKKQLIPTTDKINNCLYCGLREGSNSFQRPNYDDVGFNSFRHQRFSCNENIQHCSPDKVTTQPPNMTFSYQSSKINKNEKHVSVYQTYEQTSNESIDSTKSRQYYGTAQSSALTIHSNKTDKGRRKHTELSLSRRKKLYRIASILNNVTLISNISNTSTIQSDIPVRLDDGLKFECSDVASNYCIKSSRIKYFNDLYDESVKMNKDSNLYSNTKFSNYTFDYDKVQTTLQEAQEFSIKLEKLLETYETVNKNFISISQRMKTYNDDSEFIKFTQKVRFEQNIDSNKVCYVGDTKALSSEPDLISSNFNTSVTTSHSSNGNETTLKPILGSHNLLENVECIESQMIGSPLEGSDDVFGDVLKHDHDYQPNFNSNISLKKHQVNSKRQKYRNDLYKSSKVNLKRLTSIKKVLCYNQSSGTNTDTLNKSANTEDNDIYNQDESLNTEVVSFTDADFYKDEYTETYSLQAISNPNDVYRNVAIGSHCTQKKMDDKVHSWNILRKNIFLKHDMETQSDNKIFSIPLLEVNIKEAIGIISQEIRNEFVQLEKFTAYRKQNKAREPKIYDSMKSYLNQLIAKVVLKSELNNTRRESFISKSKQLHKTLQTKCIVKNEPVKASFSDLRRISDHTVLVKWNIPKNISNVRGYELQVDGRAVQKIFSPKRSMAVITCLPHTDRVLLTILTLTNSDDIYNSNTIVYQPRNKTR